MAKVRLVAYRKKQSANTFDATYELDLQEEPNISLNYQFADIKEPEKRKASYSQTFKLPFTKANNEFFQNWYEVNLESLIFNTRKKFNATLYVGTVPQFEGVMQLRAVYQKGGFYEVVLMSNAADLFSVIGNTLLRDVFKNDDGTYDDYLNHTYKYNSITYSWYGNNTNFVNTQGDTLQDSDAQVNKVMYPMSITEPEFYYGAEGQHLRLTQAQIDDFLDNVETNLDNGVTPPMYYTVPITQFRPAIQLKYLFQRIIANAGFSYTSTFIDKTAADGGYFGKLFMTTCNHIKNPAPVIVPTAGQETGAMIVGHSVQNWGGREYAADEIITACISDIDDANANTLAANYGTGWQNIPADTVTPLTGFTVPYDGFNLWNESNYFFIKKDHNQLGLRVRFVYEISNIVFSTATAGFDCLDPDSPNAQSMLFELRGTNGAGYSEKWIPITVSNEIGTKFGEVDMEIDISGVELNEFVGLQVRARYFKKQNSGGEAYIRFGARRCLDFNSGTSECSTANYIYAGLYNEISCSWTGFNSNVYDQVVNVPFCIDDKLKQKDFLKDIIQRFNLVVIPDPDDQTNLLIETYDDFLASGNHKFWTDKLDLDKEIIVKDTTSMQKSELVFTDLEDKDLMNKSLQENYPDPEDADNINLGFSPYGNYTKRQSNQWASGVMKNNPVFSPYINQKVFTSNDTSAPTQLSNMAVQYEFTYNKGDTGYENELDTTQPKLFYYNGLPTPITQGANDTSGSGSTGVTIYMHQWTGTDNLNPENQFGTWTAHAFTVYPLCSPYELTPNSTTGISELSSLTNSLYWNVNPPLAPELAVFNYNTATVANINSLFYTYWNNFINQIYNTNARIMECYLNLNEVDIFNFKFNDEIFIKDTYWRILNISNYQVGSQASTKVTLLKSLDTYSTSCTECDYVIANINGSNMIWDTFLWCPDTDPDCPLVSTATSDNSFLTSEQCCTCAVGGDSWTPSEDFPLLGMCQVTSNSPSILIQSIISSKSFFGNNTKSLIAGKIAGLNNPLTVGTNNTKYGQPLLPYSGNDIVIKYNSLIKELPQISGESHRMVLTGFTIGNTRGYAYPQGNSKAEPLHLPSASNAMLRVKGISTVIGGTNATYPIGTTESFAYYTAFKNRTQLGTAGGVREFALTESGIADSCTMHIAVVDGALSFGLDDSQTDTKRIWQISVDMDVNLTPDVINGWRENFALFQNYMNIQFENFDYLIWN